MYSVSAGFERALKQSIRDVTMRLAIVDLATMRDTQYIDDVIEGTVYVDTERAMRRTSQMRISNDAGIWTPTNYESTFWWNTGFALDYGVKVGDEYEYQRTGTFMVDVPEVLAEDEAAVLNVDGSDLWKKFQKSTFALPKAYFVNATYNSVISDFADDAGVTRLNLDPLLDRATTEKTLQAPLYFEIDDNRGDKLWDLADKWDLDIYFDVYGTLVTRDRAKRVSQLDSSAADWTFSTGDEAMFVNVTKTTTGDDVFNHVVVSGELDDGGIVVIGEAIDDTGTSTAGKYYTNNPTSPTRVDLIGDRVKRISDDKIRTTAAALALAKTELQKGSTVTDEIRLPAVPIPHFEGYDILQITEPVYTKINGRYFLERFDIPMRGGSQQEIAVKKVRSI